MRKLVNLNIYNNEDMELLKTYNEYLFNGLNNIRNNISHEEYLKRKKKLVSIKEYFYTKGEINIKNFYEVQIEKDIKVAKIYPILVEDAKDEIIKISKLLLNSDIEEVFTFINKENKNLINSLKVNNYESLGLDDNGMETMLFEQNKELEEERSIRWK